MDIRTVKRALENYAQSACNEEMPQTLSALGEINAVLDRFEEPDLWEYDATCIPIEMLMSMLNYATYDMYGKLARVHNGNVPFGCYAYKCRQDSIFTACTTEQLRAGYEYLRDLWQQNEEDGQHNKDGTFSK